MDRGISLSQLRLFHNDNQRQDRDAHNLSHFVPQDVQHWGQPVSESEKVFTANWDALIDRLRALVDDCVHERANADAQVKKWQEQLERLDVLHSRLDSALTLALNGAIETPPDLASEATISPPPPNITSSDNADKPETTPHKDIIADIIRRQGRSMSTSAIARQAHKDGTIISTKGYRGVYSSVTTTLKRYDKLLFIRVRRGLWNLRERRQLRIRPVAVAVGASVIVKDNEGKAVYSDTTPQPHLN
jgi:hypothetical protein